MTRSGLIDNLRRQAVTLGKAVGNQIADFAAPLPGHRPQRTHADSAGGRAIAIIVGDDQDVRLRFKRVGQQHGRLACMGELGGRDQQLCCVVQFAFRLHASRCIDTCQQRRHALLFKLPLQTWGKRSGFESGHRRS